MTDLEFEKKLSLMRKKCERYKREKELLDEYREYIPEHIKRKTSNIMLVISVIAILVYVIADYVLQSTTGYELSPTITPYYFAFWTGEIFVLAGIKISKIIKPDIHEDGSAG